jgi:hypothetical protein
MGYEVCYTYYEKLPEGGYNKEELKSMKRKVGDPLDDTPLEVLASKILAQLARRDIWVQDAEVFEYKKNKITFKETQGGIILKNHKFTLDTVGHSLDSKEITTPVAVPVPQKQNGNGNALIPQPSGGIAVPPGLAGQIPLRAEIFDPEPDQVRAGLVRGKFTIGKRYPIFKEQRDKREAQFGKELPMLYTTIDDTGKMVVTPGVVFRPVPVGLIGNFDSRSSKSGGDGLVWDGVEGNEVIDIRRR